MNELKELLLGVPESKSLQRKAGIATFTPAPGSVKVRAVCCGIRVWIGPKQQAVLKEKPETPVVCPMCTARNHHTLAGWGHLGGQGGQYTMENGQQFPPQHN